MDLPFTDCSYYLQATTKIGVLLIFSYTYILLVHRIDSFLFSTHVFHPKIYSFYNSPCLRSLVRFFFPHRPIS